jgi:DNA-binding CsgD family transcriptional regulator
VEALAITTSGPAASIPLFEMAATQTARIGRALERLWITRDMAAALEAVDRSAAIDMLREVAADAKGMRALSEQQLAMQTLRGLGVRTWGRAASGRTALTDRELKIATLVGGGASNPEIAGSLFLSRKTVERHVSNILGKFGARNRTELASLLTAQGSRRSVEAAFQRWPPTLWRELWQP